MFIVGPPRFVPPNDSQTPCSPVHDAATSPPSPIQSVGTTAAPSSDNDARQARGVTGAGGGEKDEIGRGEATLAVESCSGGDDLAVVTTTVVIPLLRTDDAVSCYIYRYY